MRNTLLTTLLLLLAMPIYAADSLFVHTPKVPILIDRADNILFQMRIKANRGDVMNKIVVSFSEATDLSNIASLRLYYSGQEAPQRKGSHFTPTDEYIPTFIAGKGRRAEKSNSVLQTETSEIAQNTTLTSKQPLPIGINYFWVSIVMKPKTSLFEKISATLTEALVNGSSVPVVGERALRYLGLGVKQGGDDNVMAYRIPAIAMTKKGTLIAVYDMRYNHSSDLQGKIDIGICRSTDKGETWGPNQIALSMGEYGGLPHAQNGIGDPAILIDNQTNTIWIAGLWTHGAGSMSTGGMASGIEPDETGQFILARSDDDGLTWSKPINITHQIKNPCWGRFFQGPGRGITMKDGTLVFPMQYIDSLHVSNAGIIFSKDHGETWQVTNVACPSTTESQVAEIEPGVLMLNMRNEYGKYRSVSITRDLGKTWTAHISDKNTLREPVCNAGFLHIDAADNVTGKDLLLFSNPNTFNSRDHITIKASTDKGITWPENYQLMIDEESGWGYSTLELIDRETIGILYESSTAEITFQKFKLKDILKDIPALIPEPQQLCWTGTDYISNTKPEAKVIMIKSIPEAGKNESEAYRLTVAKSGIQIEAVTEQGVYWAKETIRQLTQKKGKSFVVAGCEITDWPAYRIRGFMQDVGRTYISTDELKREIEQLSHYKINVFHWHLTENQSWRLESRLYPQLNNPKNTTRLPGKFYTLAEARELESFCNEHNVTLIPEIDMPGHSEAFTRTFGFDMQSEEGMKVLKNLVGEVCETFKSPYLHIGTDEVKFKNPAFVPEMAAFVHSKGKKTISWSPGYNYKPGEIDLLQIWSARGVAQPGFVSINSRSNYLNHFDNYSDIIHLWNNPLYDLHSNNCDIAGAIAAVWTDRYVQPESQIVLENNLYPNVIALAERSWKGGQADNTHSFAGFEDRLLKHKNLYFKGYPFGYVKQSNIRWRITDAFPNGGDLKKSFPPEESLKSIYKYDGLTYSTRDTTGAAIYLRHTWGNIVPAFYSDPQENSTAYAWTYIYSPEKQDVGALIEFQNYSRSDADLPPRQGTWDYRGSRIWINDTEILPPHWTANHTVKSMETLLGNENSLARKPIIIHLNQGWNKVFMKLPIGKFSIHEVRLQKWMFNFVLVTKDGSKAVDGLIYSPDKKN